MRRISRTRLEAKLWSSPFVRTYASRPLMAADCTRDKKTRRNTERGTSVVHQNDPSASQAVAHALAGNRTSWPLKTSWAIHDPKYLACGFTAEPTSYSRPGCGGAG